jgi:hypothetical protein
MTNFTLRAVAVAVAALCVGGLAEARQAATTAPAAAPVASTPAAPKTAAPVAATPKAAPATTVDKPLWKELSRLQQIALDPLRGEWDKMDGLRKQKWLEIANRFSSLKPDEQMRVQERMRAWLKMTPEERRVVRENYTLSKKLDKTQKSAKWEQYQQLPEEEKRKLAADAATKKGVTNLPPKSQSKAVAPVKPAPVTPAATNLPPANPAAPVSNAK